LQVPPPTPPTNWLAQKLREPASFAKVQHMVLPLPAFVQSLGPLQSWTCSVPEQVNPPS
jgi:hypothetical protein